MLAVFEQACPRAVGRLVAFGSDLVLSDEAAADLFEPVDHADLQAPARGHRSGPRTEMEGRPVYG